MSSFTVSIDREQQRTTPRRTSKFTRSVDNIGTEMMHETICRVVFLFPDEPGGLQAFDHEPGAVKAGGIITAPDVRCTEIRQGSLEKPLLGLGFPVHGIQARAVVSAPMVGYVSAGYRSREDL